MSRFSEPVYPRPELPPREAIADYYRAVGPAMLPWSLRARGGAPVAAPVTWDKLDEAESAVAMTIADADEAARRARRLRGWGESDQALPSV